ncbi:MAG: protein translocase subunit SecD [Proteobacteria bacterium]|nr:protein translocase subunit SecD [Pseudomonadota bacterium]
MLINGVFSIEIDHTDANVAFFEGSGKVYKTTDGGSTWVETGDSAFKSLWHGVKDIVMHPDSNNILFLSSTNGLYRSDDNGDNWTELMTGNFQEIEFHPANHNIIYVIDQTADKTEFYKSTDAGQSWVVKTNGWPDPLSPDEQKRTEIATTPAAPNRVYALATGSANGGSGLYGIYISSDAGESWTFQCCGPQPAGAPSLSNINMMAWSDDGTDNDGDGKIDYPNDPEGVGRMAVLRRPIVTGDNLTDAQPGFDQQTNVPLVRITFDRQGAVRFADATSKNVGKEFAIVLDNEIISAPVIREAIMGGQAQISGSFTIESAKELSALLRAGSLPAPLTLEDQRSVGPDLGADSVAAGKMAAIIGFVAVMVFIILSYGRFGLAANVALIINMVLIAGVLSLLGATLTLPGIAGIVLTIGMAVDANVLVFERIREEIKLGNPPMAAVSNGYSRAMTTILDANITTLIAAIIMFQYGTGPVRGFAVTLSIGIITSVFSAVILTRLMLSVWLKSRRPKTIKV